MKRTSLAIAIVAIPLLSICIYQAIKLDKAAAIQAAKDKVVQAELKELQVFHAQVLAGSGPKTFHVTDPNKDAVTATIQNAKTGEAMIIRPGLSTWDNQNIYTKAVVTSVKK